MSHEYLSAHLDGSHVMLLFRNAEGELRGRRVTAEYVSYFRASDLDATMQRMLRTSQHVVSLRNEGEWLRIGWRNEQVRADMLYDQRSPLVQLGIPSYEGDVDPIRRWCTDHGITVARPRRVYLDIETDSRVSFAEKEEMRVLAWALVDEEGESHSGVLRADTDEAEKELLDAMWMALRAYDQVVAWNGDNFDFPVIFARSEKRGCVVNANRWLWLDHMVLFKRLNMHSAESGDEKQSMALGNITQAKLGDGKEKTPAFVIERFGDKPLGALAWDLWDAGGEFREVLVRYNLKDTDLLRRLEQKTGYIALFQTLCEVCHLFGSSDSLNPTRQMDGFMLRLGLTRGYHFPTRRHREVVEQFKGAFVMEPKMLDPTWRAQHGMTTGFVRNVHVCDFASLYPSIILTWNMSPDTLVQGPVNGPIREGHCRAPSTGVTFSTETEGILTVALHELIRLRKEWNEKKALCAPRTPEWYDADRRSTAYKVAANSFYGVVGSPFSRFFDKRIAESVTQNGVWLIEQTIAAAEARGFEVVYGDTDSCFVVGCTRLEFEEFVKHCNEVLYPSLLKKCGCKDNFIKLAYEKEFRHLVMTAAKRYCNPPETPIWMGDASFKSLCAIEVGDEVVGWRLGRSQKSGQSHRRVLCRTRVTAVHRRWSPIVKVTFASGRTLRCTPDHRWLHARRGLSCNSQFLTPKVGRHLAHVINPPRTLDLELEHDAAWLGGMFDGEGSLCSDGRGQIVISQSERVNPEVCRKLETVLTRLGFSYHKWTEKSGGGAAKYAIHGGRQSRTEFVSWCRPAKSEKIIRAILTHRFAESDTIVKVESDGEGLVFGLTTETGNYVAWGFASKNCGVYAHFKGKRADQNSKPEVKGLEFNRGDAAKLARTLQGEIIDLIVADEQELERYHEALSRVRTHVLEEALPIDEVKVSKALSKALREYVVKKKTDGTNAAQPPHVMVAKILKERGAEIRAGSRVDYIVTDGSASPMKVIPAEDYTGEECDRFHIWDSLVFPPTYRLLQAAFPLHDWSTWEKTRPPKPRAPRVKVLPGQMELPNSEKKVTVKSVTLALAPALGTRRRDGDFVLRFSERGGEDDEQRLDRVKQTLARFPGQRRVVIHMQLLTGYVAVLDTQIRVSGSPALLGELSGITGSA